VIHFFDRSVGNFTIKSCIQHSNTKGKLTQKPSEFAFGQVKDAGQKQIYNTKLLGFRFVPFQLRLLERGASAGPREAS
jgi:hypothetical protein